MSDPLTQARDRIADLCGLKRPTHMAPDGGVGNDPLYYRATTNNPIPASLDFVSKVWPDRWDWSYGSTPGREWEYTSCGPSVCLSVQMSDSELADRMTLLLKILEWLKANDPSAFAAAVEKIRKEIGQ